MKTNYQAMILCAGFGTRLRPLTDLAPKPLLPIFNLPILDLLIKQIIESGISKIAINTHYLPKFFDDHFALGKTNLTIEFELFISHEFPEILGSGGAFAPVEAWRKRHDLIVVNGDIVSDISLEKLIAQHEESNACVTFTVLPQPLNRDRAIHIDKDLNVIDISQKKIKNLTAHGNAGVYIYSDRFFKYLPKSGAGSVLVAFEKALKNGEIMKAFVHDGFWASMDSLDLYRKAHTDLLRLKPSALLPYLKIEEGSIEPLVFTN